MPEWNYGDAYLRHPIASGQTAVFPDHSRVTPHDIFDPLPAFMQQADLLFIDPPWNQGNLTSFYTKAGQPPRVRNFDIFLQRLFQRIGEIAPSICYVEIGKDALPEVMQAMRALYSHVTFFNSHYYRKPSNICYVVRGSQKRGSKLPLDYLDEADIITWVGQHEDYTAMGDLCIGRGLVALSAHQRQRPFLGTELNPKRLSVLLERLTQAGAQYILEDRGTT